MPNSFLTLDEVAKGIKKLLFDGKTPEEQRATAYDIQSMLGGFPWHPEERKHYIATGKPWTKEQRERAE